MILRIIYQINHVFTLERPTQIAPKLLLQAAYGYIATILGSINIVVSISTGKPIIPPLRHKAAAKIQAGCPRHQRHSYIIEGNINLLSLPRALRMPQSNHNGHPGRHCRVHIGHQNTGNSGLAQLIRLSLTAHSRDAR